MQLVVSGLFLFPVKSCRGTRVRSAKIDARGIVNNRRYMITDSSGMFVSQRAYEHKKEGIQVTSLAQIQPEIKDGLLILSAPQMGKLYLPLSGSDERRMTAFVWDKPVEVFDQGDTAAMWLTDFISDERPGHYRLVRICDDEVRSSKLGGGQ